MSAVGLADVTPLRRRWFIILLSVLAFPVDATVERNLATFTVSCDDSVMDVRMTFENPFKGIVYTPNNFFNPNCSYGATPDSTSTKVRLYLPHVSCGMKLLNDSGQLLLQNSLIIVQHRMLDTVFDYIQNVTCRVDVPLPETPIDYENYKVESQLSFTYESHLIPEKDDDDETEPVDRLVLAYQVRDDGEYQDMLVMNCYAHDDRVINKKTNLYQLSNPFGCASENDTFPGFRVIKNPNTLYDMTAFSPINDMSLFARGRLYVTCGAKVCEETCEPNCDSNDQQGNLYFDDIATIGIIARQPGRRIPPPSLAALDRFDRQRRSQRKMIMYQELDLILPNLILPDKHYFTNESETTTESLVQSPEVIRTKRSIRPLDKQLNVILMQSDYSELYTAPNLVEDYETGQFYPKTNFSDLENDTVTKVKLFMDFESSKLGRYGNVEQYIRVFIKALVAVFALVCISAAVYSLFSFRKGFGSFSNLVSSSAL